MARGFLGIDVGTGSARAGVFDAAGNLLGTAKRDIPLYLSAGEVAEQSSRSIWAAVCAATREAVALSGLEPAQIGGIGFDATCSLVVLGPAGEPISVGDSGDSERDIIVWMDHRAIEQTGRINSTQHAVLNYVGGVISPEMETPKLLWLKENMPQSFAAAASFFDLTDFLTWRATGSLARSSCTVTCKWTYLAHERRWDEGYFREIGLGELAEEGFARIGTEIVAPGTALGGGLTPQAAVELGLSPGIPVAAGLIDAHAGGVATIGAQGGQGSLTSRLAYVMGTSACTMASAAGPAFVPGVWGPYLDAMVPGYWLNEGGQSAAGAAIDHLVRLHPAFGDAANRARAEGLGVADWLGRAALARASSASATIALTEDLHVVPDFLGNRAPLADPEARALIAGLSLDSSVDSLVALYVAGIAGLGYGLRQILAALAESELAIDTIVVSGGAGRSPLVRQLLADTTGVSVVAPETAEPVLLGGAMLAAVAGGRYADLPAAMAAMSRFADSYAPAPATREEHDRRYAAYLKLQAVAQEIRRQQD
jgi:D-ribulokinase